MALTKATDRIEKGFDTRSSSLPVHAQSSKYHPLHYTDSLQRKNLHCKEASVFRDQCTTRCSCCTEQTILQGVQHFHRKTPTECSDNIYPLSLHRWPKLLCLVFLNGFRHAIICTVLHALCLPFTLISFLTESSPHPRST